MCNHKKWTPNCYSCNDRFLSVKPYSYTRNLEFQGKPRNGLYLGIEIEVECGTLHPAAVLDSIKEDVDDIWEFKMDGSLNNGVEFESQPMGISRWLQGKHLVWLKKLPKQCKSHDTTTCGLHIHVNRNQLSPEAVGKINYFINKYQSNFEVLGWRHWNNYCASDTDYPYFHHRSSNKYQAVNLSRDDTVEFRFPRGTLFGPTIKATIALISAVCVIVPKFRQDQLENDDTWALFVDIVKNWSDPKLTTDVYLYLNNYLKKKGF